MLGGMPAAQLNEKPELEDHPVHQTPPLEAPTPEERSDAPPGPAAQADARPAPVPQPDARPASPKAAPRAQRGRPSGPILPSWAIAALFVVAIVGALVMRQQSDVRGRDATMRPGGQGPAAQAQPAGRQQPASVPSPAVVDPTPTPKPPAATLRITTTPAGAQVELDGVSVGITALTLSDVKPGLHKVKISKAGFRSVSREVEVAGGETLILDLTLSAAPPAAPQRRRATPPPPPPPP